MEWVLGTRYSVTFRTIVRGIRRTQIQDLTFISRLGHNTLVFQDENSESFRIMESRILHSEVKT